MKLVPDESKSKTIITDFKLNNTESSCLEIPEKSDKSSVHKYWTFEDDEKLSRVSKELNYDWKKIAVEFPGRNPEDLEQRWGLTVDPSTNNSSWTKEEDAKLETMYKKIGGKWKLISEYLPGRLPNSVKSRFYSKISKQSLKSPKKPLEEIGSTLFEEDELIDSLLSLPDDENHCLSGGRQSIELF